MIFLNLASSAAALVLYLPGVCSHTDTETEKGQIPEYFKIFGKNTIFNEHPVVKLNTFHDIRAGTQLTNFERGAQVYL